MVSKTVIVQNNAGIHLRPTGVIIKECQSIDSSVTVRVKAKGQETDLKDHIGLLLMGLCQGDEVEVHVSGPDESSICDRIAELFERRYDFPPRVQ
ncbi:MAG: HPr family phosphocarrier protein [Spirochaetota bacterium]